MRCSSGFKMGTRICEGIFESFLNEGGALVNVHAANNAHQGWNSFEGGDWSIMEEETKMEPDFT